jgi:hypothetical protein
VEGLVVDTPVAPRTEDAKLLADSLLGVPAEVLATSLAMMRETNLLPVVWSRLKSTVRWADDDFQKELAATAADLAKHPRGELALELLLELNQTLGITPRNYVARRDVEDNAAEVVQKSVDALKGADKKFKGDSLQDLVVYQVQKLITGVGEKLDDLSEEDRRKVVSEFRKFIEGLPEEQQAAIKKELGADELSDALIGRALATGAATVAFATVVEVAGFSAYTFATSSLAAITGAVGLTLPFGAYTGLTSFMAVLASPWFILLLMSGGGYFAYAHGQAKLRRGLAPLVVTQLATAGASGELPSSREDSVAEFLTCWNDAAAACRIADAKVRELEQETESAGRSLSDTRSALKTSEAEITTQDKLRMEAVTELADLLCGKAEKMAEGDWHPDLATVGEELIEAQKELDQIVQTPVEGGWRMAIDAVRKGYREVQARSRMREVARAAATEVHDHHTGGSVIPDNEVLRALQKIDEIDRRLNRARSDVKMHSDERRRLEKKYRELSSKTVEATTHRNRAEQRYWGLEKLR